MTPKEATEKFVQILEAFEDKDEKEKWLEGLILLLTDPLSKKIIQKALESDEIKEHKDVQI